MRVLSLLALLAVGSTLCATAGASRGTHRFFLTPGANAVSCELSSAVPGLGTFAYCVIGPHHALSVQMTASGSLKICRGRGCLSNSPEDATILALGKSVAVGPFRCTSFAIGVRCVVVASAPRGSSSAQPD